jgi:hypothetical protein
MNKQIIDQLLSSMIRSTRRSGQGAHTCRRDEWRCNAKSDRAVARSRRRKLFNQPSRGRTIAIVDDVMQESAAAGTT